MESSSGGHNLPKIQVFRPTMDEFRDFSRYVEFIELQGAHKAGVAKIVPPKEWTPRKAGYDDVDLVIPAPILQSASGNKGLYQQYNIQQKPIHVRDFATLANDDRHRAPRHNDLDELERKFWKNITFNPAVYGADISGSLYDADQDVWNVGRLGTILDRVGEDYAITIEGVNTAYLYFGMWKTSFCWHTEDMDLYSINYLHYGAPKSWYAVPPEHGRRLERLATGFFPAEAKKCPAFLRHKMTHISPHVLRRYSIPFNRVTQEAGEFIVTFPYSYHSGYNHGYNCAESTNFASLRWIEYGKRSTQCTCNSDTVRISMDCFIRNYQPERYELWKAGLDVGPHPEDDQSKLKSSTGPRVPSGKRIRPVEPESQELLTGGLPELPQDGSGRTHQVSRRHPMVAQLLPEEAFEDAGVCEDDARPERGRIVPAIGIRFRLPSNNNGCATSPTTTTETERSRDRGAPTKRKETSEWDDRRKGAEAEASGKRFCTRSEEKGSGEAEIDGTRPPFRFIFESWGRSSAAAADLRPAGGFGDDDSAVRSSSVARPCASDDFRAPWFRSTNALFRSSDSSESEAHDKRKSHRRDVVVDVTSDRNSSLGSSSFLTSAFSDSTHFGFVHGRDLPAGASLGAGTSTMSGAAAPTFIDMEGFCGGFSVSETFPNEKTDPTSKNDTRKTPETKSDAVVSNNTKQKTTTTNETKFKRQLTTDVVDVARTAPPLQLQLAPVANLFQFLATDEDAEIKYNELCGRTEPFCQVCSLFTAAKMPESVESRRDVRRPFGSRPIVVKCTFVGRVVSEQRRGPDLGTRIAGESAEEEEESVLLICGRCRVCVHAGCYGALDVSDESAIGSWICDRCSGGSFDDACCLCLLRGGALKRTTSGRWCHVVCALVVAEARFEDVALRQPINVEGVVDARRRLKCVFCTPLLTSNVRYHHRHRGACVRCTTSGCRTSFHVTCARVAGVKFEQSSDTDAVTVACLKHSNRNAKETNGSDRHHYHHHLSRVAIDAGEYVYAKHRNNRYYRCLVLNRTDQVFFRVLFEDGSFSNDTFPDDIQSPICSATSPPSSGTKVKVRWTDDVVYDAVFRGANSVCLYQVRFEDGSTLNLERKDVWSENEQLPQKVKSRLSVATEMQHRLFRESEMLTEGNGSRTRNVQLRYIRDRDFTNP